VISSARRETILHVSMRHAAEPEPHRLILGLSLVRAAAFELALEKAVETGATEIIPVNAARSNVKESRKRDRWQKIIVEAAKQSKRYYLPELKDTLSFEEFLDLPAPSKIVFAERNGASLKSALSGSPVLYLIGPEGGWTDTELESAIRHQFRLVSLGPSIL